VPLNATAIDAIDSMAAIQSKDAVRSTFVFTTETGEPMIERNAQRALDAILAAARLPHFSHHDLRRTFGTHLASSGVSSYVLQSVMGHENISTTFDHYVFAFGSDLADAMKLAE
jgi:site-specific recombinase XerD